MIIYGRAITKEDLDKSDNIIYYLNDYVCFRINKVNMNGSEYYVVKRKKVYKDFQYWFKKLKTKNQVLMSLK